MRTLVPAPSKLYVHYVHCLLLVTFLCKSSLIFLCTRALGRRFGCSVFRGNMLFSRLAAYAVGNFLWQHSRLVCCRSIRSRHTLLTSSLVSKPLAVSTSSWKRYLSNEGAAADNFLTKLEPTVRSLAEKKNLHKAGPLLDKLLACVRAAVSQAVSGDPNENFDITDHLDGLTPMQIGFLGQLLLEVSHY